MRTTLFAACLLMSLTPPLFAVGEKVRTAGTKTKTAETSPSADPNTKPPDEPNPLVLKNKSSFQFDAGVRSPFWPIGWKPAAQVPGSSAGGAAQGEVPAGAFLVTSITLGNPNHFAIVNGKSMSEGQQFGLQVGTQIFQVTIKRIEDGRVIIGRGAEEIVVPLRRK